MELITTMEYFSQINNDKENSSTVEILRLGKGDTLEKNLIDPEIVFIKGGRLQISYEKIKHLPIQSGDILLLPPACHLQITAGENSHILFLKIKPSVQLYNDFAIGNLFDRNVKRKKENKSYFLKTNPKIDAYLDLFMKYMEDDFDNSYFYDLKIKELFYYFRKYYSKEMLVDFFSPLMTNNSSFTTFVYQNHMKAKTVQQFANLYGYSLSCFEKQFKKVFGTSAYQWMTEQKAKQIYHKLVCSDKSLVEIADEHDFSSLSQFCDFCKRFLGKSPGKIRREKGSQNDYFQE